MPDEPVTGLKTMLQQKDPTGEATGTVSTSRVLAWAFAIFSMAVLAVELLLTILLKLAVLQTCDASTSVFGLKTALTISVGLGIVSVGFYLGRAGGAFDMALKRIFGSDAVS